MWFRYYNPRLGRFMSADPLSGSSGDPQSLNRFAYARNNPATFTDPLGLFFHDAVGLGGCDVRDPSCHSGPLVNGSQASNSLLASILHFGMGGSTQFMTGYSSTEITGWLLVGDDTGWNELPQFQAVWNPLGIITVGGPQTQSRKPWETRKPLVALLRAKNSCSDWFNQGQGSAATIMSWVPILNGKPSAGPIPGPDAWTSTAPADPIYVSSNGRFYSDSLNGLPVGGVFEPGSQGARMIILLHELAHKVGIIPSDGFSDKQSMENTETVMQHCGKVVQ
jgi:hypothetical protein